MQDQRLLVMVREAEGEPRLIRGPSFRDLGLNPATLSPGDSNYEAAVDCLRCAGLQEAERVIPGGIVCCSYRVWA
jgi:hypothetical protein